jgi:hypothetical protein
MAENVCVRAACLLQGIRENREPAVIQRAFGQVSLIVGGLGETDNRGIVPGQDGGGKGGGAEGVADNVTDKWRHRYRQLWEMVASKNAEVCRYPVRLPVSGIRRHTEEGH